MKSQVYRLLAKNISKTRIAGFILSNLLGLAIIVGGIFFYEDAGSIWKADDSFVKNDWLVVNRRVSSSAILNGGTEGFSAADIRDIEKQPWVRKVGAFSSNDYRVWASVDQGGRGMSTMLFFESVPDDFIDTSKEDWHFSPGDPAVPVIISKDYLALYNFGFAGSAGLPQMSEGILEGIPLRLTLTSDDGHRSRHLLARIVGFSNRINTILVPQQFMDWSNSELGSAGASKDPSRLIIDVNSPGDVAIRDYLDAHDLEVAGDKTASSGAYLLKVVIGVALSVGGVITLMSFFILLLSMSLLMEKNKEKIHSLLMLGYRAADVARPYVAIVTVASVTAFGLAVGSCYLFRLLYLDALRALGAQPGGEWIALLCGGVITLLMIFANIMAIRKRVASAWR